MLVEPEYGVNIIVGVIDHGQWQWYVSDKELWFLDLTKLRQDFQKQGYDIPEDYTGRFNLPIVNETSAARFLQAVAPYMTTSAALAQLLRSQLPIGDFDQIADLVPALLVNFDAHSLASQFPEPASFERYVPPSWVGEFRDFLADIPTAQKYWLIDGKDYLEELLPA